MAVSPSSHRAEEEACVFEPLIEQYFPQPYTILIGLIQ
jgi:hypothetical protein